MTATETIIDRIRQDGEADLAAKQAEADQKAARLLEQADKDAAARRGEILAQGRRQADRLRQNAQSACELAGRNAALLRRRQEIDKTVAALMETLCGLEDGAYFDRLVALAAPYAGREGVLWLNERDLARLPADFTERLQAVGVTATVSKTPRAMPGGFVLQCGEIEYCADFAAIIEEKRDEIEDRVHRELFL